MPPRQLDQVEIVEQRAAGQRDQRAPGPQRRLGDVAQQRRRGAFDDDVEIGLRQPGERHHRNRPREPRHRLFGPPDIPRRHGGERDPVDPAIDMPGDDLADRPEPGDADPQLPPRCHSRVSRCLPFTAPAAPGSPAVSGKSARDTIICGSGACRTSNPRSPARARNRASVASVNTCIGIAIFAFSCRKTSIISGWFSVNEPSTGTSTISIVPSTARSASVSVWCKCPRCAMHKSARSNTKIELPLYRVSPKPRTFVGHCSPDVAILQMMVRHPAARIPAAQYEFDARLDHVGIMRRMRVVHRHDVGVTFARWTPL